MSELLPILEEFLTPEELATELGRNKRTLDRWDALGIGPPRTRVGRTRALSTKQRAEMACGPGAVLVPGQNDCWRNLAGAPRAIANPHRTGLCDER